MNITSDLYKTNTLSTSKFKIKKKKTQEDMQPYPNKLLAEKWKITIVKSALTKSDVEPKTSRTWGKLDTIWTSRR